MGFFPPPPASVFFFNAIFHFPSSDQDDLAPSLGLFLPSPGGSSNPPKKNFSRVPGAFSLPPGDSSPPSSDLYDHSLNILFA